MANTANITTATWIEGATSYTKQLLNPKMQKALRIHAMALELARIGGTNYVGSFETLIDVSDRLNRWMNPDQIAAAEVAIDYANAANSGATVPAAIADKLEVAKKLIEYDDQRLDRAILYLKGALGYHSSF